MSDIGNDRARLRFSSKSQIGYVEEILINILARLPVKSIMAFKSVAKHWLSLISEPNFPKLQASLSKNKPKYIICPYPEFYDVVTHVSLMEENGTISRDIPVPTLENICSPEMICYLNGLIVSVNSLNNDRYGVHDVDVRIFNPITGDAVLLPKGSPSRIIPSVGVIFDPETHDFKAFRFFVDASEEEEKLHSHSCEVYTFSSATWRLLPMEAERPNENPCNPYTPSYVTIAGKMYWLTWSEDARGDPSSILSVDMNENFEEIKLPKIMHQWSYVIELEGCLAVVHVDYPGSNELGQHEGLKPYVEVYKYKSCGWCLRAQGELDPIDICSFNSVAARDNEIFFVIKLRDESFNYIIFDLNDGTWEKLIDLENTFEEYSPVAFPFVESLLKCSEA